MLTLLIFVIYGDFAEFLFINGKSDLSKNITQSI